MSDIEQPQGWRATRTRARAARRARAVGRVKAPVTASEVVDPLQRKPASKAARFARTSGMIVGAALAHGLALGGFFGANAVLGGGKANAERNEPIELVVLETPEPEPEPEATPPEATPDKTEAAPPRPKPKPKTRRRPKRRPPPPDPIDVPKQPPPPKKARRIVGLSLKSTVKGSGGPSFAVGNTRMGQTAREAENPEAARTLAQGSRSADRSNRRATRAPIGLGGIRISKPKYAGPRLEPPYPDDYRAQSLEAKVTVEVTIGTDGRVVRARVVSGSPYSKFEASALSVARKQRWVPAKRGDEPIEYTIAYSYFFRLKD